MKGIDFAKLGRKLMHENPQAGLSWQKELNQCKAESETDTSLINSYFLFFCHLKGINIEELRFNEGRTTNNNINNRRFFIAVIMQMYDPLNINGFTGRKMDKVREKVSDVLNCNQVWISQVWPSIQNDLINLRGYKTETQEMITLLKQSPAFVTENPFINDRRIGQLNLFQ